ncbi:MAG: hypothetical protein H7237_03800 [Alkalinema sp. FL-bin-369]|nr:hypothetical protein [Leptolyngbyaceae cyanobacterium LF-bin-369]
MAIFSEIQSYCGETIAAELQRHYAGRSIRISYTMPGVCSETVQKLCSEFHREQLYVPFPTSIRNDRIRERRSHGSSYADLIKEFGLSERRLQSIVSAA